MFCSSFRTSLLSIAFLYYSSSRVSRFCTDSPQYPISSPFILSSSHFFLSSPHTLPISSYSPLYYPPPSRVSRFCTSSSFQSLQILHRPPKERRKTILSSPVFFVHQLLHSIHVLIQFSELPGGFIDSCSIAENHLIFNISPPLPPLLSNPPYFFPSIP